MVLRSAATLAILLLLGGGVRAETPSPASSAGEVEMPLADYLRWVERADAADRARLERREARAGHRIEVTSQRIRLEVDGDPRIEAEYELTVFGSPAAPRPIPFPGLATSVEVMRDGRPSDGLAAVASADGPGFLLVARESGRYRVVARGRTTPTGGAPAARIAVAAPAAPLAWLEVAAPADVEVRLDGATQVAERIDEGSRRLTAAQTIGRAVAIDIRRRTGELAAEPALADASLLTLFQFRPDGVLRHDIVLFEVVRGEVDRFEVTLPPELVPELVATDEGPALPVREGATWTVARERKLTGSGYVVFTSRPAPTAQPLAISDPVPAFPVRERFVGLASSVAVDARPEPSGSWTRVDLADLPPALAGDLAVTDLVAAWRATGLPATSTLATRLLPASDSIPASVRTRETTTLLTPEGTLLHRELMTLGPLSGALAALELELPESAEIWTARIDGQPVRPLERGGRLALPLALASRSDSRIELIYVLARAVPSGREEITFQLGRIGAEVEHHDWRLLLPETSRYRFREGALRPIGTAAATASVVDRFAAAASSPAPLGTQGRSGLRIRAVDPEGAPLPGARVVLDGPTLSAALAQTSDAQGWVQFRSLPAGPYRARAELEGFNATENDRIELAGDSSRTLELRLTLAFVAEELTVVAETPTIDTSSSSTGATYSPSERWDGERATRRRAAAKPARDDDFTFRQEAENLKAGLVGGVRPIPVVVPESGKSLRLAGLFPPTQVTVTLETKPAKR